LAVALGQAGGLIAPAIRVRVEGHRAVRADLLVAAPATVQAAPVRVKDPAVDCHRALQVIVMLADLRVALAVLRVIEDQAVRVMDPAGVAPVVREDSGVSEARRNQAKCCPRCFKIG
jgi:hypothetical protein